MHHAQRVPGLICVTYFDPPGPNSFGGIRSEFVDFRRVVHAEDPAISGGLGINLYRVALRAIEAAKQGRFCATRVARAWTCPVDDPALRQLSMWGYQGRCAEATLARCGGCADRSRVFLQSRGIGGALGKSPNSKPKAVHATVTPRHIARTPPEARFQSISPAPRDRHEDSSSKIAAASVHMPHTLNQHRPYLGGA